MQYYDPSSYRFARVYLLVDCNNFFCSCERLFRPDLVGQPLLVLSNNDGCVVARSAESKALGIPMGIPVFKIRHLIKRYHIVCFSSNFSLYRDVSRRIMSILERLSEHCAIYSIDEAFLSFSHITEEEAIAQAVKIRNAIDTLVGIKVGIGIATTKTLAKLANHHAKVARATTFGICSVLQDLERLTLLKAQPIDAIWGVGRRLSAKLHDEGIATAAQLAAQDQDRIKRRYSVVLMRTVAELNNISAIPDEDNGSGPEDEGRAPSYQIMWSRSYSKRLTTIEELQQALANYGAAACHKLRNQHQYCRAVTVFIRTSYFGDGPKYSGSRTLNLSVPTSDTREILGYIRQLLDAIFRPGFHYSKAGIVLSELSLSRTYQADLLATDGSAQQLRSERLMAAIDRINHHGHHVFWAAQGTQQDQAFKHQKALSPRYTTHWDELPEIE